MCTEVHNIYDDVAVINMDNLVMILCIYLQTRWPFPVHSRARVFRNNNVALSAPLTSRRAIPYRLQPLTSFRSATRREVTVPITRAAYTHRGRLGRFHGNSTFTLWLPVYVQGQPARVNINIKPRKKWLPVISCRAQTYVQCKQLRCQCRARAP